MVVASLAASTAGWASKATDSCCFVFIWSSSLSFGQPSSLTCDYRPVGHFSTRCCHAMPDRGKRFLLKIDDSSRDIASVDGSEAAGVRPPAPRGRHRAQLLGSEPRAASAARPSTASPPRRWGAGWTVRPRLRGLSQGKELPLLGDGRRRSGR